MRLRVAVSRRRDQEGRAPIPPHYWAPPQSGRIEARTGLRMMPTSPRSPLSFRTAGFPQYGWKDGVSDGAFPLCTLRIRRRRRLRNTRFPAARYRLTGTGLSPAGSRQFSLTHRNRRFESIPLQDRVERTAIARPQPIARPKVFDVGEDRVGRWIDRGSIWRTSTARSGIVGRSPWRECRR
jgi:hypothetical protein